MMLAVAERKNQIGNLITMRGFTFYSFAKLTGLAHHQVKRIAKSPTIPDGLEYKTLRTLAAALEVKLDDLETEE